MSSAAAGQRCTIATRSPALLYTSAYSVAKTARMASSRVTARSFRGTNDFFTVTLDYKETVETLKQCRPVKTDNDRTALSVLLRIEV